MKKTIWDLNTEIEAVKKKHTQAKEILEMQNVSKNKKQEVQGQAEQTQCKQWLRISSMENAIEEIDFSVKESIKSHNLNTNIQEI